VGRLLIIVAGYLVRGPLGGIAWHHLQYVLGLSRLGHHVYFLEDSDDYPSCYDPRRDATGTDPRYGLAFAADAFERLGMRDCWAYHDAHRRQWSGPAAPLALEVCARADVLLNLSGISPLRPWLLDIPVRVLIDTDPLFTQVRHLNTPEARERAALHTAFFTFGENIGAPGCRVPADGFPWRPTRQPIVSDAWTRTDGVSDAPLTSVLLWVSYPPQEHDGQRYGMKAESFAPYLDLPRRCPERFELGLGGEQSVRDDLAARGWKISDPREVTLDPWTYQAFIRASKAEFGIAKHGYVASASGWFSERSAAYLACGRPVIHQETGFSNWLRADGGVLAFGTPDEALDRIEDLNRSFVRHCRQARDVVDAYFDFRRVLPALLEAL
jgi:hypothetical protein